MDASKVSSVEGREEGRGRLAERVSEGEEGGGERVRGREEIVLKGS